LKKPFSDEPLIEPRKKALKKVFQTNDQRTGCRRLTRLREKADAWGLPSWIKPVVKKLPSLIGSVGRVRLPWTTNAVERFFRAFNRFYKTRCGFHSVVSAKRALILFLVVYLFTQQPTRGCAPIEVIVPEAVRMPLYRLINDPWKAL
jgi:transposase-like protein